MTTSIEDITRRTKRYWYTDGLTEICAGILILLLGFLNLVTALANSSSLKDIVLVIGQPLLLIGGFYAINRAVRTLKERITYPRTGFVAYKKPEPRRRNLLLAMAIVAAIVVAIAFALLAGLIRESWIPALTGAFLALCMVYLAYNLGLLRFYAVAVFTFLVGLGAVWLQLQDLYANAFLFCGMGLGLLASGGMTLYRYLHNTLPVESE